MKKREKSDLLEHVRKQLEKLRKRMDYTQEDWSKALGIQRTGYHKKEKGPTPVTLSDIDILSKAFQIGISEFFRDYPGFYAEKKEGFSLSEEAKAKFPSIEQLILAANNAATSNSPDDHKFLCQCAEYVVAKLSSKL